jgi:hypothetical protein
LEFRGNKGLLILAPSLHKSGVGQYAWEEGHAIWQQSLPPTPEPVKRLLLQQAEKRESSQGHRPIEPTVQTAKLPKLKFNGRSFSAETRAFMAGQVQVGQRNDRLFAAAREMRDYLMPQETAVTYLLPAGQAVGLDHAEIIATIDSAYSRPPGR